VEPTTAANAALGVKGFIKAALGVRFFAGAFLTTFFTAFFAGAFFATTFLAGAFFAGAFFATTFLAGAFFAAAFLAGAFLATTFLAGDFFAAVFFAAFFAVAIFIFLLEVSETPLAFLAFCRHCYRKGEKPFFPSQKLLLPMRMMFLHFPDVFRRLLLFSGFLYLAIQFFISQYKKLTLIHCL
jgi:hypothetical protein